MSFQSALCMQWGEGDVVISIFLRSWELQQFLTPPVQDWKEAVTRKSVARWGKNLTVIVSEGKKKDLKV